MLKKSITYTDYNDVERTEDYYFNLNKAELMEMEASEAGGLSGMLERIVETKDIPALSKTFKDIILKAYGEKSADGKHFIKYDDNGVRLANRFAQTEAYSVLYVELLSDSGAPFVDFVNKIIPEDMRKEIEKANAEAGPKVVK